MILAIDVGTTHCKAALFAEDGGMLVVATRPMVRRAGIAGTVGFAPETVWNAAQQAVSEATTAAGRPRIAAVGIASMAETGLFVDRNTGEARSDMLAWFDTGAAPYVEQLAAAAPEAERFSRFGIYPSFKNSLAKILWARDHIPGVLEDTIWLSTADYIAFRLTGAHATDYSLAGRTYAFDLSKLAWHEAWLHEFALPAGLFPQAQPSGTPVGAIRDSAFAETGLPHGTPVAISGHDHVCAAVAAGAAAPGRAFDSMGTAEALLGALEQPQLNRAAHDSGLTFGILPLTNGMYWLGGLSTSGGALDWLRGVLGDPPLSYAELQTLLSQLDVTHGSVLFLPYLAGSGAPMPRPEVRGAFLGLALHHTRADLLKAVLEGTAFQLHAIRRAAETLLPRKIDIMKVAGGGTRNQRWLQIKADIYGAPVHALQRDEATLFGAALVAGVGCGVYRDAQAAFAVAGAQPVRVIEPDVSRHKVYAEQFESSFLPWSRLLIEQSLNRKGVRHDSRE